MKQKLNTKSSTETKLVAVDDAMPYMLWTTYFLDVQGYSIANAELYQDHLSAMLLEQNGKWSSRKRTKHINMLAAGSAVQEIQEDDPELGGLNNERSILPPQECVGSSHLVS
eukprot:11719015-Ditylum_brightwellii.AAC.1